MSEGIAIDVSQFQAALKEYTRYTSKTIPVALNGKAKDLALRSAQNTPLSKMTNAEHTRLKKSPAYAAGILRRRHGGKFNKEQWEAERARLLKSRLGKGFMKSGFVKASRQFRNTADASKMKPAAVDAFANSKAVVKTANEQTMAALFDISWKGKDGQDAKEKQAIVSPAIAKAVSFVTADMQAYVAKKLGKKAAEVSAK